MYHFVKEFYTSYNTLNAIFVVQYSLTNQIEKENTCPKYCN